jgi:hypothetical protein
MDGKKTLTLVTQPEAFFHELVTKALSRQNIATQPETEFYLVNLLNQFMVADRLYEEPLAFMVKEALEHPEPTGQAKLFRRLGDVSLYTAGFFQDSLNRKLVDVDYYIDMGGKAYQQAAVRCPEDALKSICCELADRFSQFVDVLAEISDETTPKNEKNLLRLYEMWLRTRSERAAKQLQEAGILPNESVKKNWQ